MTGDENSILKILLSSVRPVRHPVSAPDMSPRGAATDRKHTLHEKIQRNWLLFHNVENPGSTLFRGYTTIFQSKPGSSKSGSSQPRLSQPGLSQPGLIQPGLTQPVLSQPGLSRPGLSQPGFNQPGCKMSLLYEPGFSPLPYLDCM